MRSLPATKYGRRRKPVLFAIAGAAVIPLLGVLLALRHAPAWYRPNQLTNEELRSARLDAMNTVDQIGDKLAARRPFDVVLSQAQCNQWLSGLPDIWPDAALKLPHRLHRPFVAFNAGTVEAIATVETRVLRAVLTSSYQPAISPDKRHLTVRLVSAHCGAIALPRFALSSVVQRLTKDLPAEVVEKQEISFENHFVWPNGRRPFRIASIAIEPGQIRLSIEPL